MKSRLEELKPSSSSFGDVELGNREDFMGSFFGEVEQVKKGIAVVQAAAKRVREITEERMLAVNAQSEEALSRELTPLVDNANARMKATKNLLERMASETESHKQQMKPSETRIRENLVNTLNRKFVDVCKDYQRTQQNYKGEIQKTVKRQLEIVKPDITNDEIDTVLRSGTTAGVLRSAILQAADPIKAAYADVADKYQDVLRLEQSVAELHQMFLDFALLTEQQGELLDQIEYQVKSANEYIEDGNKDIEVAIVYQKEIRKKWCCIIAIVVIIIGVIVLVVGLQSGAFND